MISIQGIRAHLSHKLEEWLDVEVAAKNLQFSTAEAAEQAFKEWLWGTSR